ncbi:MAG: adenosylcobinamide-phosphate synthase CbiB [Rhodoferax sp.]
MLGWPALEPFTLALALLVALGVDRMWGEPPARLHPVVGMGRCLAVVGASLQRQAHPQQGPNAPPDYKVFWLAALCWTAMAALIVIAAWALEQASACLPPWAQALLLGVLLKPLLAWRMLRDEVAAVGVALAQSLDAGRARLRWLVSRETADLSAAQVRESAIESLAENLNDSVVAPLFWFVLAGLPGAALYRWANTADAMWGYPGVYKGQNWQWAGKWAARADDGLNWLPARLCGALLMALGARRAELWRSWPAQARQTPSPNSGWPMAAMALCLGVRLGKPGVYTLNPLGAEPDAQAVVQALCLAEKAVFTLIAMALLAIFVIAPGPALWGR